MGSHSRVFLFILILFHSLCGINARGQTDSLKPLPKEKEISYDVLKFRPGGLLMSPIVITSELGLSYEFTLAKDKALALEASLLTKNVFLYLGEQLDTANNRTGSNIVQVSQPLKISGYRFQAQYKWILPLYSSYPCGMYIGPHASASTVFFSYRQRGYSTDFYKIHLNNISLLMGYQHFINNKFFFDLYFGLGYKYNYVYYYKTLDDFEKVENEFILTGVPIKLKISMGYYLGYKF